MATKIEITEANKYSTTDIAKWIRQTLKETYKDMKFSVRTSLYAGGSSISVTIIENNRLRILRRVDEVSETEILLIMDARNDSKDEVINFINSQLNSSNHQINQFHIESAWSFTKKGRELLIDINKIIQTHNHDNSDSQTDYFDVNYYVDFNLGSYDKPYVEVK